MNIKENKSSFDGKEILMVARRENNSKRSYVFVNQLQAKHVPVSPQKPMLLFNQLGEIVKEAYQNEKILVIGFAETATAIGASVAVAVGGETHYLHTTREELSDVPKIVEFCEEHSHATEQILYCRNWEQIESQTDRIVFVEDEVTTGKTILNFVSALRKHHLIGMNMKFAIASLANAMDEGCINNFKNQQIDCHYLLKIQTDNVEEQLFDSSVALACKVNKQGEIPVFKMKSVTGKMDPRIGVAIKDYIRNCDHLAQDIIKSIEKTSLSKKKVLVIGTEEFMYPVLKTAEKILNECGAASVKTHATTRSPILPYNHDNYPLKSRCALKSFYDNTRQTYIYNLEAYDYVLVITDSSEETLGFNELSRVLYDEGCKNILFIKWVA